MVARRLDKSLELGGCEELNGTRLPQVLPLRPVSKTGRLLADMIDWMMISIITRVKFIYNLH